MRVLQRFIVSIVVSFIVISLSACGGGGGGNETPSNSVPTASAGGDLTVTRNAVVPLDGSGVDADGDALAYRWVQTSGTTVTLSSTTAAKPTFTAPAQSGTLVFALVTSDGKSESTADSVTVNVENRAPTAVLLSPTAAPGKMTILDGSGSSDPDGDTLSYQWTQLSGPTVAITPSAPGLGQFQAPSTPVTLVFALTVSDGEAVSISVSVTVNVTVVTNPLPPNGAPGAPIVFVGNDLVVARRSTVVLQASVFDPEGLPLTYSWEQIEGPVVSLSNADTPYPSFIAPTTSGQLKFVLNASDGALTTKSAPVTVEVKNFAPWAWATLSPNTPQTNDQLTVTADVGDPDQDSISTRYEWKRNGVLVPSQTAASYPASLTTKNDVITVQVIASDGTLEASVDASTTIMDSPAILSVVQPPPTAVDYGDTVTFTVTATDVDGDATSGIEVAHGPAGFAVSPQGTVTWTAVGPMFDRAMDFNWGVRVSGDASSLLSGTFTVTDPARLSPVRRTGVHTPVQNSGLQIGDFDGNGSSEMLVGSTQAVSVLEKAGSSYQESWVYPFEIANPHSGGYNYGGGVAAVAAKDVNGDGKQEIFFSKNNVLIRLHGVTRRESARSNLHCRSLKIADLDHDGSLDLICLSAATNSYFYDLSAQVVVLDALTLAQKWSTATLQLGNSLAVGNVDNDSALEIVTAGGFVFDGQTQQNQWLYSQAFGSVVDTGDLDGDGIEEIAGMSDTAAIRAFSAVAKSPLWEFVPTWSDLDTMIVADANSDGRVEIITGNGQWGGEVMAVGYDVGTHSLQLQWQISSQDHGVSSIAVGDVDNDGTKDVVWGSGAWAGGDDLIVASFNPAISIRWNSANDPQFSGSFYGGALARIGGGTSRLIFTAPQTNVGSTGMRAIALDPSTGKLEFSNEIGNNWGYGRGFDIADYDLDDVDELFIGTANYYDGYFAVYDFATDVAAWESPKVNFELATAVTHGDMNADGHDDLIGITSNGYIYVFDVHAQTLLWKSTGLGANGVDIVVADLNQDGQQDIIAATSNRVLVYGKASNGYIERASVASFYIKDLVVSDLDGTGMKIYTLDSPWTGATLMTYDGQLNLASSLALGMNADSLFVEESAFTRKNLLISTTPDTYSLSSPTELWAIDPLTGAEVWHSPPLTGSVPLNSVRFIDVDSDGDKEIVFATSQGMHFTR
jgi:hypothetical protein